MIDEQGKLWGRINVIDLAALVLLLLVAVGFFGLRGVQNSTAQTTQNKPVFLEFQMLVRGLSIADPEQLLKAGDRPRIIIRNQPAGQVLLAQVKVLPNTLPVGLPNGKINYVPDINSPYSRDILMTLRAEAQMTDDGAVVGGTKLKVATPIELETARYDIKGSVIGIHQVTAK
ncbi:DUF4330 domain-containing protein [Anthocerotibacter panamensis]|uniref:DUF4330 domain-containing protein n=1 Tax=Anthocerotibacter panamensis TaxID=2857077 RepID=UPI001C408BA6|nr:DUF4330 domain-containing protein [Anthocerotibacter panamensis]